MPFLYAILILFVLGVSILIGIHLYLVRAHRTPSEIVASNKTTGEQARLLAAAVRLMEKGLNDPFYLQSRDWSDAATTIVVAYYGD